MKIIQKNLNSDGAYPPIHSWDGAKAPDECYQVADGVILTDGGFGTLTIEDNIVTAFTGDTQAWEAWKASLPEFEPEPDLQTDIGYAGRPQIPTHTNGTGGKHRCFTEFLNGLLNWVKLTGYKISQMPFSLWKKS